LSDPVTRKPVLIVVAGPNGAGKTTITQALRQHPWAKDVEFLNSDDLAQNLGGWNNDAAQLRAAQITTARRIQLLQEGKSLGFETVFSTDEKLDFVREAWSAGFFIRLFFMGVESPEILVQRVERRFAQGGHTVPRAKILARYVRSMANLSEAISLVDRAYLYDNSLWEHPAQLCARTIDHSSVKVYGALPDWVTDALSDAGMPLPKPA
jgi:predicted ABC-type ATPase